MTFSRNITFNKLKRELVECLSPFVKEAEERQREVQLLLETATGLTASELILRGDDTISPDSLRAAEDYLARRIKREPPQYCLGKTWFMGHELMVRHGVFIPRSDTETLVEVTLRKVESMALANPYIAEIGVGAGGIAVAILSRLKGARMTGIDISKEALELTLENARKYGLESRLDLLLGDFRNDLKGPFDIVISNPPYIPMSQKNSLAPEVADYEPNQALFGWDEDGLGFYRDFSRLPLERIFVAKKGAVVFECGDGQSETVSEILTGCGMQAVTRHDDLNGLARVVAADIP